MSEPPKVRLVRCPNCENLLPEVTDFSVYQCGGCGAILRAKNENGGFETFSDKSGKEGELGISSKFEKVENISDTSEVDKSNAGSSALSERRGISHDRVESYRSDLKTRSDKWAVRDDEHLQNVISECESENGSQRPVRPQRGRRIDTDASSSYQLGSDCGYQLPPRSGDRIGSSKGEYGDDDKAELLRKLDALKEQLSRSCEVTDNPRGKFALDRKTMNQDPYCDSRDRFSGSMQYPVMNKHEYPPGNGFYPQKIGFQPYGPPLNPHHPSCSCLHCYSTNQNPIQFPPTTFGDNRFYNFPRSGPQNYDPRIPFPPSIRTRTLKPSGHKCLPVAGGAPFLVCHNCLELLHLANKRAFPSDRKQMKVKCGACSSVMVFSVANNKLVSVNALVKKNSEVMSVSSDDQMTRTHINRPTTVFSSEDFDKSGYDFHAMDQDQLQGRSRTHHSKSSSMNAEDSSSAEKEKVSTPPPVGSPLQDHFDYSTKYGGLENGNASGSSKKSASRQTSMKDIHVATEIDIPSTEYANTGSSLESGESSTGDQISSNKTSGSFFAIAKKSFKSNKQVVDSDKRGDVTINGHLILDEFIKKAEKVAGKINPGHYWYDFRAGFWGVMGGPCLGIIPPYIEEFNYPMPENCAGGNTGVFVNGRELHNKDMQLLCSRGLPPQNDKSYIIEISGRVLDEDTGKELESLGKLAPTVERMKCGFGMKVPKRAA
ncbi:unnamed protein product [Cuscuta epithymum]|uniref:Zinc-ribbon domain-containing protein n=1 Tax=Cuscuta epithymum TaxID=186058 RepID=A0AAV0EHL2_9ASTE|nr:unnamed protein product [Cuscuta epithymum]